MPPLLSPRCHRNYSHFTYGKPEIRRPAGGQGLERNPQQTVALWLARCPHTAAASRNFSEGFDVALTLPSPAFLLPTSPIFSCVPLPQDSACTLNNTQKPSVLTSPPDKPTVGLAGRGGRCGPRRGQARAARLPARSLAPRFVRHSKAPLPHHLLAKLCLRKGFCRLTSDSL